MCILKYEISECVCICQGRRGPECGNECVMLLNTCITKLGKSDGCMDDLKILRPFQQYFSHIRTMRG